MDAVDRIRNEMSLKGLKQKEMIEALCVNQGTFAKWLSQKEENRRDIPNTVLAQISQILAVDIEYLLGLQDEKRKTKISQIPLIGKASCGVPNMYFDDYVEHIPVSDDIARDGVYAVEAEGDSMLPKIKHGDIIICDKEMACENGNIVHYTTNDGESGIKKYSCDPKTEMVTLFPLNPEYTPMMLHRKELICARAFKIQSDL
jgi:SOS-response transcriptional repressor LexA